MPVFTTKKNLEKFSWPDDRISSGVNSDKEVGFHYEWSVCDGLLKYIYSNVEKQCIGKGDAQFDQIFLDSSILSLYKT